MAKLIEDSPEAFMLVDDGMQDNHYSQFIEQVKLHYSGAEHGLVRCLPQFLSLVAPIHVHFTALVGVTGEAANASIAIIKTAKIRYKFSTRFCVHVSLV